MAASGDADRLADGSRASGEGLSRRHFMYGTAAMTAGAAVLGPRLLSAPERGSAALATGTGFGWIQSGPKATGTGSVAPTLATASRTGTLLVATLLSNDPSTPFTVPSGSGWRLAKAALGAAGRAEIWYYPGTPGNPPHPGNPGNITSATFTTTGNAGSSCYGALSEYSAPPGAAITVLDAVGQAAGASSGSFSLTAASGNVAGDLGIGMVADFFGTSVTSGTWTAPQPGWTQIRQLGAGLACWAAWYDLSLTAEAQSIAASFSVAGENGWAFAFAAFRAVVFQPIHLDGGEMTTMVALDPTGQELVMGGDVEGLWRTADFGDHWQLSQDGLYGQHWRSIASVAWSLLEPGTVYACVGSNAAQASGGFLVSTDGGVSWSLRSADVQFQGNDAGSPPRPGTEGQGADRSVGDLLVQDDAGGFLYTATYKGGIFRSSSAANAPSPVGTSWTDIGSSSGQSLLNDGNHYARCIVMNPLDSQELFAGFWDWDPVNNPQFGGVYRTTNAQADPSKVVWSQLGALPTAVGTGTISDLKIIGGFLYASSPTLGIFRHQLGGTGWTALSSPLIDTTQSLWTSIDGYAQAGGTHVLIVGCGNGVAGAKNRINLVGISIPPNFPTQPATYTDLTGSATIQLADMPPDGQPWWRYPSNFSNWLGGGAFLDPHILIDPNDNRRVYVTGGGGFFRTYDVTQSPVVWTVADNGAPMSTAHLLVADPSVAGHVIVAGSDYPQTDLTDPTAWDTANSVHATKVPQSTVKGQTVAVESHAVAFDPQSNVFTGTNQKYGQNAGGAVYWRAAGDTTYTWHDTGYNAALDPTGTGVAQAPIGLFAGVDNTSTHYIVVVSQGADVWRATPTDPTMQNKWKWTQLSTGIATGNVAQYCPVVSGNTAGHLFCYDRAAGLLYRSTNFGANWALAWPLPGSGVTLNVSDGRSGWLAANPAVNGELWLSTNDPDGLYKLSNAGGTITYTQPGGTYFPNGAGGIVFTSAGQPYVMALSGPLPAGSPLVSPQLLTLPPGSTTWTDAGDAAVGSYASAPGSVAITTNSSGQDLILIASTETVGIYGVPVA